MVFRLKNFAFLLVFAVSFSSAESSLAPASSQTTSERITTFSPAQFRLDEFSLVENLTFPKGESDVGVLVRCVVGIERNGNIRNRQFFCVGGNDETAKYEHRVLSAMAFSKMKPATLNGKNTHVTMRFSVAFERKGGVEKIEFYPNHLLNLEQLGTNYIAPQLIHHSARFNNPRCALNFVGRAVIDTEGLVQEASVAQSDAAKRCQRYTLKRLKGWKFIPGFVDGHPVTMNHMIYVRSLSGWI